MSSIFRGGGEDCMVKFQKGANFGRAQFHSAKARKPKSGTSRDGSARPLRHALGAHRQYPAPYTLHTTHYTLHTTHYTLHPTTFTLHSAPYTLHPTPYTLHHTPYTVHPTPYTLHPTPYTLHPTSYTQGKVMCDAADVLLCPTLHLN